MENVNLFDVFVLVSIVALMYNGFNNGFIKETISIVGILAGLYLGLAFADNTVDLIDGFLPSITEMEFSEFIVFVTIYIVSLLATFSIGTQASSLLVTAQFKIIDDLGGIVMAIVKSILILSVLVYILSKEELTNNFIEKINKNSKTYPSIYNTGKTVMDNMPNSYIITDILSNIKDNFKKD